LIVNGGGDIGIFAGTDTRVSKPIGYIKLNMIDFEAVEDYFALDNVKNPTPL